MKHFSNRALACLALSLFAKLLYANDGGFYISGNNLAPRSNTTVKKANLKM